MLNIISALAHVTVGTNLTPPTNAAQGANPALWVPTVQAVSTGYPIVGYGTFDLPQCYANVTVQKGVLAFLKDHYTNTTYRGFQQDSGLVSINKSGAAKFLTAVTKNILANKNSWNTNIGNPTACASVVGR